MSAEILFHDSAFEVEQLTEFVQVFHDELAKRHGESRRRNAKPDNDLNLTDWGKRYLADHFTRPPSRMHKWLARQLDSMQHTRGRKLNVLGPRGGAKSTLGTLAFLLRAAVHRSEPYIWIISDTRSQALAHLENIKSELTDNKQLSRDYPNAVGHGPVWRAGSIVLRNGVAIDAFGTGQRMRGRRYRANRPTLIVCDDLQNDGHIQSAAQRESSRTWFHGTLLKAGTSRTNIVNLATALHRDALAMQLTETPGWTSRTFRSIEKWPDAVSLWETWKAIFTDVKNLRYKQLAADFYKKNETEMKAGAQLLWPEEEDLYTLMCMRAESGVTAFEREKQNSPINPEFCEWPEKYFDESIWFDDWPQNMQIKTIAIDPSKGTDSRRGDYSAIVALGVDNCGIIYIEADLARRPTSQIVADGVAFCLKFQPDAFGIESNQFQELLGSEFEAEFSRQGFVGARPSMLDNRVNKQVRIRRLGPYLSGRQIRFKNNSPSTRLLVRQLQEFPVGDHDDGPDAAEMALRMAKELTNGKRSDDGLGNRLPVG